MSSSLARSVLINNYAKSIRRTLYWVKKTKDYSYIGLEKDTIYVYEGINNIEFSKSKTILKGDVLFSVDSNTILDKNIRSNNNYYVLETNKGDIKNINLNPEEKETNWIIKVKEIGNSEEYNIFLDRNPYTTKEEKRNKINELFDTKQRYTPYTYYSNDFKNNQKCFHHVNVNENDLIQYIIGNH
jgi:glycine cleavage system H lipoate-binding protein